ncbi:hypothetical protein BS78_09G059300 [Paspalum vaginatum]|nr:hypothetical protein BS78_09G059300 [Paspalum vaginatum]
MASKFFRVSSSPVLAAAAVLLIVVAAAASAQAQEEAPAPSPSPAAQAAPCPSGFNTLQSIEKTAARLQGQVVFAVVNSPLMSSSVNGVVAGLRRQYPTQQICVCAPNIGRIPPRGGTGPVVTYICSRG